MQVFARWSEACMGFSLSDQKSYKKEIEMDLMGFFPWPGWGHQVLN